MSILDPGPVLVVGAGPTGLVLAIELCRHGVPCRIIDQNRERSATSKAIGIHSRTLEVFESLGILDRFLASGRKVHGFNAHAGGKRIVHITFDELEAPYPFVLALPQSETERLLGEHLAALGVQVERCKKLTGLTVRSDHVEAEISDLASGTISRSIHPYAVGADGAHSTVRKALEIPFEGEPFDEDFMLADVSIDSDLPQDETHVFLAPEGTVGWIPLPEEGRCRLIVDLPGHLPPAPVLEDMDQCLALFQQWLDRRAGPGIRISKPSWISHFRIQSRIVPRYRSGRAFLAGDAAHIHSPAGGQGMNTGIQDAFNLAWKLGLILRGRAAEAVLDSYQAERRPIAAVTVRGTEFATRVVTLRGPVSQEIRNRLATFITGLEVVQARAMRTVSGLANNYRRSPIVREHRVSVLAANVAADRSTEAPSIGDWLDFGSAPHAGDRAPDVEYLPGNRLFERCRGTAHQLFLFDGGAPTPAGYAGFRAIVEAIDRAYRGLVESWIVIPGRAMPEALAGLERVIFDEKKLLHARFGAGAECLYLVRPDGYVGYRSQPADKAALFDYLQRFFPVA
jgi:2-polyprenyl-6-methoxyphenol hydroxylase-like FAD-dependent oxidoreductase